MPKALFDFLYGGHSDHDIVGQKVSDGQFIRIGALNNSTHIIGDSGSGKSTFMANRILADIVRNDRAVIVLDPHSTLAQSIALYCPPEHAKRVVYFSPFEQREQILGLNPFEVRDELEYELKVNALLDVFKHSWHTDGFKQAPTMQNTLETLIRTLLSANPQVPTNFLHMLFLTQFGKEGVYWRKQLAPFVAQNPAISQNWREWKSEGSFAMDVRSSRQKTKHMIANDTMKNILCQPNSAACFDFQDLIAKKGILLVALGSLEDEAKRLLGSIILSQLFIAVQRMPENRRTHCAVYADEFYYFNPEDFRKMIVETRKFKLYCTIAHQNLKQLDTSSQAAAASCQNSIVFNVTASDAEKLRKLFMANDDNYLPPTVISNLKDWRAFIRIKIEQEKKQTLIETVETHGTANRDVAIGIYKRSVALGRPKGVIDAYIESERQLWRQQTRNPTNGAQQSAAPFDEQRIEPTARAILEKPPIRIKEKITHVPNHFVA